MRLSFGSRICVFLRFLFACTQACSPALVCIYSLICLLTVLFFRGWSESSWKIKFSRIFIHNCGLSHTHTHTQARVSTHDYIESDMDRRALFEKKNFPQSKQLWVRCVCVDILSIWPIQMAKDVYWCRFTLAWWMVATQSRKNCLLVVCAMQ